MDFTQPVTEFVSFNLDRVLRASRERRSEHLAKAEEAEEAELRSALEAAGYDDAAIEDAIASTREQP
ncbi:hypothetical protein ACFVAJ_20925 [Agromyces sp. NPDC057679]|uniref:hypothetical protein n=1 Tax=Agromyces sp. NPDC057679 TaxID=3346207 RepID=UPI00366E4FC1